MSSSLTSKAERWRAVKSRSPSGDEHFVYAVRTTGVFCRPSCAARRPRRDNVEFYDSAEAATRAGYRPCKRCRPADAARVNHSSELMAGERIRYVITECSLGHILIAWTERGVCEVAFTDSLQELRPRLERHFPRAELELCEEGEWAQAIVDAVEMASCPDIPLDVHGTAFQERVWRALRAIPAGETRSYSEIAELVGQPSAVRAVAKACASNPVAFLVPCHRVVRKDGSLSGYRWGVERKRELLRREASRKNEDRQLDEDLWANDGRPRYSSEGHGRLEGSGDDGDDRR